MLPPRHIPTQDGEALGSTGPDSAGVIISAHFLYDTSCFGDGSQQSMVNFCVGNLDQLLMHLVPLVFALTPSAKTCILTGLALVRHCFIGTTIGWCRGAIFAGT